jgi:TRAP-type C4-dicarboxylate transport system substrate-binding protein
MIRAFALRTLCAIALLPTASFAQPIKLKLAFISSDRSTSYLAAVKPFVDAVNADPEGLLKIEVSFNGALGKDLAQQARIVLDTTADIAYVVPGLARERFADNTIVEMPGLFASMRESTSVFTHLVASKALKGYDDYFVIGAFVTEPEAVHSKTPITSLDDLKGKKLRVNNPGEAAALEKFGATPILMPVTKIAEEIGRGNIDGAVVSPSPLNDYGIKRVATYHYLLGTSGAPLLLLMSRNVFEALPKPAQAIIVKYSGDWAAARFIETYEAVENPIIAQLESDPHRNVTVPSQGDLAKANAAFTEIANDWAAKDARNAELLKVAKTQITKLREGR